MRLMLLAILFLLLYGPRLRVFDLMPATAAVASGLFVLGILHRDIRVDHHLKMLALLLVLLVYALVLRLLLGSPDWTGVWVAGKLLLYYSASAWFVAVWGATYKEQTYSKLIDAIILCSAINALAVYAAFFSSSVRSLLGNLIFIDDSNMNWIFDGRRVFDISMGGGSSASFVFAVVFVLALLHWDGLSARRKFAALLVAGATFLLGRSGALIVLGAIAFISVRDMRRKFKGRGGGKIAWLLSAIMIIGIVVAATSSWWWTNYSEWLMWAFEWYFRYTQSGTIGTGSTDALTNMYFFPEFGVELFFGSSNYGRSSALDYIASDAGYVRLVWGGGIFGALLFYGGSMVQFWFAARSVRRSAVPFILRKRAMQSCLLMSTLFFAFNLKEAHVAARGSAMLFYLVPLCIFSMSRRYENKLYNARHSTGAVGRGAQHIADVRSAGKIPT